MLAGKAAKNTIGRQKLGKPPDPSLDNKSDKYGLRSAINSASDPMATILNLDGYMAMGDAYRKSFPVLYVSLWVLRSFTWYY